MVCFLPAQAEFHKNDTSSYYSSYQTPEYHPYIAAALN